MKKIAVISLLFGIFLLVSCGDKTPESDSTPDISGYWMYVYDFYITEPETDDFIFAETLPEDKSDRYITRTVEQTKSFLKSQDSGGWIDGLFYFTDKGNFSYHEVSAALSDSESFKTDDVSGTWSEDKNMLELNFKNSEYISFDHETEAEEKEQREIIHTSDKYIVNSDTIYSIKSSESSNTYTCYVLRKIDKEAGKEITNLVNEFDFQKLSEAIRTKESSTGTSITESSSTIETTRESSSYESKLETEQSSEEVIESSDITHLTEKPSSDQIDTLQILAEQQFDQTYPYKGSKMHSILGVVQNWTKSGDEWFYKVEATIVNAFGAEKSTVVEVTIKPTGPDEGVVSILEY